MRRNYSLSGRRTHLSSGGSQLGNLDLLTSQEVECLRALLQQQQIPLDLKEKLAGLEEGDLGDRFVAQNCQTMLALLLATYEGSFLEPSLLEQRLMLSVLAYVRKDNDSIPDWRIDGFTDDMHEIRVALVQLGPLLNRFKTWRLRNQVPSMWRALNAEDFSE